MEASFNHPVFLAIFAMAVAGGIMLLVMVKFGQKLFGNGNAEFKYIQADLSEIKADLKGIRDFQLTCRMSLSDMFIPRSEFLEWKKGREEIKIEHREIWEAINNHYHDVSGGVVRSRGEK